MSDQNEDKGKMDRRMVKGDETYQALILSAMEIISESGISRISAAKLADRAKVSKSNVFHHFKTVQEIPEVVLNQMFSEMNLRMIFTDDKDLKENLIGFGEKYFKWSEVSKDKIRCFFSFYHEGLFQKRYHDILQVYLTESRRVLKKQIELEGVPPTLAATYAAQIIATLDGMGMQMLIDEDMQTYVGIWELQIDMIMGQIVRDREN